MLNLSLTKSNSRFNTRRLLLIVLLILLCTILILTTIISPVLADDGFKTRKLRNVTDATKERLKQQDGIPTSGWKNYEIDHITPLWKGGTNSISNLQVLSKAAHKTKTAYEARQRAKSQSINIGKSSTIKSSKSKITSRSKSSMKSLPKIKSYKSKTSGSSSSKSSKSKGRSSRSR